MSLEKQHAATIMIIDDDPENLRVLGTMLSRQGYEVRSFPGGLPALRSAEMDPPDLILLDIRMPGMDGFEVCSRLKANDRLSDIPVIFLSAVHETDEKLRAFELGGADYVTKPFNQQEMLARIDIHLKTRRLQLQIKNQNKRLTKEIERRAKAQKNLSATRMFLSITNRHTQMKPMLDEFVSEIKKLTGCKAVGIRVLDDDFKIPYEAYDGFSQKFYDMESPLSIQTDQCMCINVVRGDIDVDQSYYTESGSFYANSTTKLLDTVPEAQRGKTRNACNQAGYESVGLFPMRSGGRIIGLLHVADKKENRLPFETVTLLERISLKLGSAFTRIHAQEELVKAHAELERRVAERTEALAKTNIELHKEIEERRQAQKALQQSKDFNQSVLMSLQDHIAVLDRQGNILEVNTSWLKFARENDVENVDRIGRGANYFQVCRQCSGPGSDEAQASLAGIQSVMEGRSQRFELEYDCYSPTGQRWFLMTALPFQGRKGGVIVAHTDINQRKQSEIELKQAYREIAALQQQVEAEKVYLQEEIKLEHNFEDIIGASDELKYALFRVEQVAKTDSAVIIFGETGTGKELMARAIHSASSRSAKPLIKVDCAALPGQLIESELFGHEKGAFTGAVKMRPGRFELAHNGTIFLDEIGELPLELQGKLLRVLQDGEFERLGGSQTLKTDVRVIVATNRDLEALVQAGNFRQDLWYRLNVFPITIPPLRARKGDIPLLVNHFTVKISKKTGKIISQVPRIVMDELMHYDWPGNIRELEHVIERSVITSPGIDLRLADQLIADPDLTDPNIMKSHADMEHEHILRVLERTQWVIEGPRGAARILELHPNTLRYRMQKLGIRRPEH